MPKLSWLNFIDRQPPIDLPLRSRRVERLANCYQSLPSRGYDWSTHDRPAVGAFGSSRLQIMMSNRPGCHQRAPERVPPEFAADLVEKPVHFAAQGFQRPPHRRSGASRFISFYGNFAWLGHCILSFLGENPDHCYSVNAPWLGWMPGVSAAMIWFLPANRGSWARSAARIPLT